VNRLTYGAAIGAAMAHAMETDPRVFVMGIGVDDHRAVFGTTKGLVQKYGRERVFDTPISEGAMTGIAVGAALGGLKPVHIHIRTDFLYLATDQLLNMAAKWRAMFGGSMSVPMVVRAVVGRSWGQGAQHSQSLQSLFMHVPGLKVVMPTTPADASGLLLAAVADPNPVLIIEHRLLYDIVGDVPDPPVAAPLGRAFVRRQGKDLTIVANSHMVVESLRAAEFLAGQGIEVEVVDPVSLVPLDRETITASVRKTGRLLVVDASWTTCGVSAEIAALAAERAFDALKGPVRRMGMAPVACPVSKPLEDAFYPSARTIAREVLSMVGRAGSGAEVPALVNSFKGPF
jgi:pyruvate dehydrogenase E1 component beta subunit